MNINNEIRIQHKTKKKSKLYILLDNIRENTRNHDEEKDDTRKQ